MIELYQAALLGTIQGLTEFIPISSTAHLRILPAFMDFPDPGAAYTAVLQLGSLAALIYYFWSDIKQFAISSVQGILSGQPFKDQRARMAWFVAAGTIPVSVFGLAFSKFITGPARSLYVVAASLIILAVILYIVDRIAARKKNLEDLSWKDALLIGLAQAMALIPGSSRAGTTLTMGLYLGYTRESAMRFSFLLGIPAIALSGFY
jgi:undecaprenyl-diphosphatase